MLRATKNLMSGTGPIAALPPSSRPFRLIRSNPLADEVSAFPSQPTTRDGKRLTARSGTAGTAPVTRTENTNSTGPDLRLQLGRHQATGRSPRGDAAAPVGVISNRRSGRSSRSRLPKRRRRARPRSRGRRRRFAPHAERILDLRRDRQELHRREEERAEQGMNVRLLDVPLEEVDECRPYSIGKCFFLSCWRSSRSSRSVSASRSTGFSSSPQCWR